MDKRIFLSYCQKNKNEADEIDTAFSEKAIELTRDERDLKYRQSLKEFMKEIREHDFAILLISHEYLTSENCMYEFLQVLKEKDFENKMLPIIMIEDFFNSDLKITYIKYWKEKEQSTSRKIKELVKDEMEEYIGEYAETLRKYKTIENEIGEIIENLQSRKMIKFSKEKEIGFQTIFDTIKKENAKNNISSTEKETMVLIEKYLKEYTATKEDIDALFPELNNKKLEEENHSKTNIGMPKGDISFKSQGNIKMLKKKGEFLLTEEDILEEIFNSSRDDWNVDKFEEVFTYKYNILLTIEEVSESERDFFEEWANCHPDKRAHFHEYEIKYQNKRITSFYFVSVDGYRALLPLPDIKTKKIKEKHLRLANIIFPFSEMNYEYVYRSHLEIDYDD